MNSGNFSAVRLRSSPGGSASHTGHVNFADGSITLTSSATTLTGTDGILEGFDEFTTRFIDFIGQNNQTITFTGGHDHRTNLVNLIENGLVFKINGAFTSSEDLSKFNLAFSDGTTTMTVIPEPGTYAAILGLAVLGLALYRRRLK